MAAYHHVRSYRDIPGSLLIQHGSYQSVSLDDQPSIHAGEVSLYRHRTGRSVPLLAIPARRTLARERGNMRMYLRVQADMLPDSILSFQHDS
jgi:hypothetical protein